MQEADAWVDELNRRCSVWREARAREMQERFGCTVATIAPSHTAREEEELVAVDGQDESRRAWLQPAKQGARAPAGSHTDDESESTSEEDGSWRRRRARGGGLVP